MKNKIYSFFLVAFITLSCLPAHSQCTGLYRDTIYHSVIVEQDTYSIVYNQAMIVYQPVGDTSTMRPLFIMAHGGSFVDGDRTEGDIDSLCVNFAKRGYVCASIDYRLLSSVFYLADSVKLLTAAYQAVSDAKAAVRYFTKDAATANKFRINPKAVIVGGNSAGAVLAVHYAYLNDTDIVASYIKTIIDQNGGLHGNSGNDGYPDSIIAIMSLAGGINNLNWIQAGDVPAVMCHGDADSTVPYSCNEIYRTPPYDAYQLIRLCGSGAMQPVLTQANILNALLDFPGDGHVPWASDAAKLAQVDTFVANFLAPVVCERMQATAIPTGIAAIEATAGLRIYPNPASNILNLQTNTIMRNVKFFDETGREVSSLENLQTQQLQLSLPHLAKGFYYAVVGFAGQQQLVRKVVIE